MLVDRRETVHERSYRVPLLDAALGHKLVAVT